MKRALFVDRDGTIIVEPTVDYQVDSLEKLEFVPGVISALPSPTTRAWLMGFVIMFLSDFIVAFIIFLLSHTKSRRGNEIVQYVP